MRNNIAVYFFTSDIIQVVHPSIRAHAEPYVSRVVERGQEPQDEQEYSASLVVQNVGKWPAQTGWHAQRIR